MENTEITISLSRKEVFALNYYYGNAKGKNQHQQSFLQKTCAAIISLPSSLSFFGMRDGFTRLKLAQEYAKRGTYFSTGKNVLVSNTEVDEAIALSIKINALIGLTGFIMTLGTGKVYLNELKYLFAGELLDFTDFSRHMLKASLLFLSINVMYWGGMIALGNFEKMRKN
jgi:hypothetical protein